MLQSQWRKINGSRSGVVGCFTLLTNFPSQNNKQSVSYQKKVAELKEEMRKSHPSKTDKFNRKLYLNQINRVGIKLKC